MLFLHIINLTQYYIVPLKLEFRLGLILADKYRYGSWMNFKWVGRETWEKQENIIYYEEDVDMENCNQNKNVSNNSMNKPHISK